MKLSKLLLSLPWVFLSLCAISEHNLSKIEESSKFVLEETIVNFSDFHCLSKKEVNGYDYTFKSTVEKLPQHIESESPRKQIVITAPFASNYLWHLLVVARIGYKNTEYEEMYKNTIDSADIHYLNQHASYLVFGEGRSGIFTWPLIFLPSYLELESKNDFTRYYQILQNAFTTRNFKEIVSSYPTVKWDDPFIKMSSQLFFLSDDEIKELDEEIEKHLPVLNKLTRIILHNISSYEKHVWPIAKQDMEKRLLFLQNYFNSHNYIMLWEEFMNTQFKEEKYYIQLNYASKNGSDANSLSYDKNIFFYDYPIERTIEFISHEVGTHIVFPDFINYSDTCRFDANKLYAAYEVLLMWYNRKVLNVNNLSYTLQQFNDSKLLKRYDEIYKEGCTPLYMLENVLKEQVQ